MKDWFKKFLEQKSQNAVMPVQSLTEDSAHSTPIQSLAEKIKGKSIAVVSAITVTVAMPTQGLADDTALNADTVLGNFDLKAVIFTDKMFGLIAAVLATTAVIKVVKIAISLIGKPR